MAGAGPALLQMAARRLKHRGFNIGGTDAAYGAGFVIPLLQNWVRNDSTDTAHLSYWCG